MRIFETITSCLLCIFLCTPGTLIILESRSEAILEQSKKQLPGDQGEVSDYLRFHINYLYRSQGKGEFKTLTDDSVLRSGDYYKIIFTPTTDAYVYIFQIDSANKIFQLFPMENYEGIRVNNFNPVQADNTYYIPAEGKSFFLDEQTGTEKIYFLASRQRDPELEELYRQTFARQQQPTSGLDEQLQQIDRLLAHAMKIQGRAIVKSVDKESEKMIWKEQGETFSVLQQHLENMCDGCVYTLTFEHR